jgi:hypothetical protein
MMADWLSQGMISRIETHPEFTSKIKGNAIELLLAVKAATHKAARAPMITMTGALTKFTTYKQQDDTSLTDYIRTFKVNRDIWKTQMGDHILDDFTEEQADYKATDAAGQTVLKDNPFERLTAFLLVHSANWH